MVEGVNADLTAAAASAEALPEMQTQGKPRCGGITPGLSWTAARAMPAR